MNGRDQLAQHRFRVRIRRLFRDGSHSVGTPVRSAGGGRDHPILLFRERSAPTSPAFPCAISAGWAFVQACSLAEDERPFALVILRDLAIAPWLWHVWNMGSGVCRDEVSF
jgi:hypothetical protein